MSFYDDLLKIRTRNSNASLENVPEHQKNSNILRYIFRIFLISAMSRRYPVVYSDIAVMTRAIWKITATIRKRFDMPSVNDYQNRFKDPDIRN